jgi:NADH-quinone oxidoreductase subunit N
VCRVPREGDALNDFIAGSITEWAGPVFAVHSIRAEPAARRHGAGGDDAGRGCGAAGADSGAAAAAADARGDHEAAAGDARHDPAGAGAAGAEPDAEEEELRAEMILQLPITINPTELWTLAPELIVTLFACLALVVDIVAGRHRGRWTAGFCLLGLGLASVSTFILARTYRGSEQFAFYRMFVVDDYAIFFKFIFLITAALSIIIAVRFLDAERQQHGEYYALIMFATLGMMLMAGGTDLLSLYISLELMSISIYVLVGYLRGDRKSIEAAMKYFLLGAFSSGILLYGISLFYGATGSTNLYEISLALPALIGPAHPMRYLLLIGLVLLAAGMCFKIAAVPFHMWAPDAYEGAPTPVTAFMSVGVKAASFAMFARIFLDGLARMRYLPGEGEAHLPGWALLLGVVAAVTITWGNIAATTQRNVKRLLAYSSIGHAGYLLLGLLAGNQTGYTGLLIYLLVYTFMNLGAWTVIISLRREGVAADQIEDLNGLAQKMPAMAVFMLVFLLSLAGIPPTAGFIGKYYIFLGLIEAGTVEGNAWMFALAVLAVVMTAVSVYYYYAIVKAMFLTPAGSPEPIRLGRSLWLAGALSFVLTLGIGILPQFFITRSVDAARRFPVYPQRPAAPAEPQPPPQTGQLK